MLVGVGTVVGGNGATYHPLFAPSIRIRERGRIVEPIRVEVADSRITITGALAVLALEGIKPSRRTLQLYVKQRRYPLRRLGRASLVPQNVVNDFAADWRIRHSD